VDKGELGRVIGWVDREERHFWSKVGDEGWLLDAC